MLMIMSETEWCDKFYSFLTQKADFGELIVLDLE